MTKFYKIFLTGIIPLIIIGCGAKDNPDNRAGEQLSTADYAEQATFTTLGGDSISVADFEGKVVVIDFWETWCKPCLASFPTLQKLQQEYPEDFLVLAVTPGFTNTAEDARSFASEHDYDFIYAMDTNDLHEKLGVRGIPHKVFIDADGDYIKSIRGTSGPDQDYQKIKKIIEKYSSSVQ